MDHKPFSPNAFDVKMLQNMTPDVKTWGQLKAWVQQNPTLVPGVDLQTLRLLQVLHLQDDIMKQHQAYRMNDQSSDTKARTKQLIEAGLSNPKNAYGQAQGSEWADEADFQSHRRAPSKEYSDISSARAAPSIQRGARRGRLRMPPPPQPSPFKVGIYPDAPSIQPQDSLKNHSYDLSWPEGSPDAYNSWNTPTNELRDNNSSSSWFAPPADVQLFQDRDWQLDHSNMAGNKARLSRENNAVTRTMTPVTDSSSQSLHQQMSGHPASVPTMSGQPPGNGGIFARLQKGLPSDAEMDRIARLPPSVGEEYLRNGDFHLPPSPDLN
jgi:hypothetical protein